MNNQRDIAHGLINLEVRILDISPRKKANSKINKFK